MCTLFKSNYLNCDEKGFEGNILCLLERIICGICFSNFNNSPPPGTGEALMWIKDVKAKERQKDMHYAVTG